MTTDAVDEGQFGSSQASPDRFTRQRAVDAAALICEDAARIKRSEVDAAVRRLESRRDLDESERAVLESMADAIVKRVVGAPARALSRSDDAATTEAALELFEPGLDGDSTPQQRGTDDAEVDDAQ